VVELESSSRTVGVSPPVVDVPECWDGSVVCRSTDEVWRREESDISLTGWASTTGLRSDSMKADEVSDGAVHPAAMLSITTSAGHSRTCRRGGDFSLIGWPPASIDTICTSAIFLSQIGGSTLELSDGEPLGLRRDGRRRRTGNQPLCRRVLLGHSLRLM